MPLHQFVLVIFTLFACQDSNFTNGIVSSERRSEASDIGEEEAGLPINEPVMIGGAFLTCQSSGESDDENYQAFCRLEKNAQKVVVPGTSDRRFQVKSMLDSMTDISSSDLEPSSTWQWIIFVPKNIEFKSIMLQVNHLDTNLVFELNMTPEDFMIHEDIMTPEDFIQEELTEISFVSPFQVMCQDQATEAAFPKEMAKLCLNGESSTEVQTALLNPYTGSGDVQMQLLKSERLTSSSIFKSIAVFEIPVQISVALERRNRLSEMTFMTENGQQVYTEISRSDGAGGLYIGNFESQLVVGQTTTNLITDFYSQNPENSVIAMRRYINPNSPGNANSIDSLPIANSLAYWIGEENRTKIVIIFHRIHVHNQDHQAYENNFMDVNKKLIQEYYRSLITQ